MTKHGCNTVFWFWIQSRHNTESEAYFLAVSVTESQIPLYAQNLVFPELVEGKIENMILEVQIWLWKRLPRTVLSLCYLKKKNHLYAKYTAVNRLHIYYL